MRIAIVSPVMMPVPPIAYGGIQHIVDEVANGLARRGHEVTVFCAGGSTIAGENIVRVESSPYPTADCPERNRDWEKRQFLAVLEREKEFDAIHFHYEPAVFRFEENENLAETYRLFSVPVVFTFHNSTRISEHIDYYRRMSDLGRYTFVFISESQRKPLHFLPNTVVVYNGIPVEKFPLSEQKERYMLFLGRITPTKGILEAIETARQAEMPLIIAARIDSADRAFYEERVKLKIDGRLIRYVGEADFSQKVRYLQRAKCLLVPILWEEPFGLVMVEALACGTPVIAFRRGSVPEIVQDGVNGYIVDTVAEMADSVKRLNVLSPQMCRQSVERRFSTERMVDGYEKIFLSLG